MKEQKEIIGIDLDQTFLTCNSKLYRFLNTLNYNKGKNLNYFEIKNKNYKLGQINKIFKLFNPQMYVALEGAVDVINYLHEIGKDVHFISNRPKFKPIIKMTAQWFKLNNVKFEKLVLGCKNKIEYAKNNNILYFIDNDFSLCQNFAKQTNITPIFYDLNENILSKDSEQNMIVSSSWKDIQEIFMNISSSKMDKQNLDENQFEI